MAPTDFSKLAVTPGTFQHVGAAVPLINGYVDAQKKAGARVTAALALPGLFDGKGGAITRQQTSGVPAAVMAAGSVGNDLRSLFQIADAGLARLREEDRKGGHLIDKAAATSGDPAKLSDQLYPKDNEFTAKVKMAQQQGEKLGTMQTELERRALAKMLGEKP